MLHGGLLWRLKKRFKDSMDEVANWRAALEEAANISGFHDSSKTGTEADFVEEVVQDVLTKLNRESSSDSRGLFGIQRKIEKIESLLCLDSPCVCCVGIWGMGGIGKTTLATAVFNRHASKFEAACFLANVREKSEQTGGLNQFLNELVREILKDRDINIGTLSIGPTSIRDRLSRTKMLIVLDDVNAREQLEVLVGDHDGFSQGSRIIITARDTGLLEHKVDPEKIYNVEGLGSNEALELFHSYAFGNKSPTTDYAGLSKKVIVYSKGHPLALKVMGSSFLPCKSKQEWEDQLKNLKRFQNKEIKKVLNISYDGLEENEKEIFLDIACFHKGYERNYVKEILDSCGFCGEVGVKVLIGRSLISISEEHIEMHDLVQEMGRPIAREQGSRLFIAQDVYQVLTNNQSDGHVQAISIDWSEIEKLHLKDANFPLSGSLDLPNSLRYLHWLGYPLKSLPSKFSAQNIVVLEMPKSQVVGQLWNEDQSPVNLKWINLQGCYYLTEVPNLSRSRKIEHIDLCDCESLVEIPSYFQHLSKLTRLRLGGCTNLKNLPEMPCNLEVLFLSHTTIEELPSSVWSHEKISHLDITHCRDLKSLPSNTCKLKISGTFDLDGCHSLCEWWELPINITAIILTRSLVVSLPTNICKLKSLEELYLVCTEVKELSLPIGNLVALRNLSLSCCKNLEVVADDIFRLTSLQELDLCWTEIKSIPASIKQAAQLSYLLLNYCESLESLPELPPLLQRLEAHGCTSLKTVSSSSTALTQGWEEYMFSRVLLEKRIFSNCPRLDQNARSNIMADAQLRIMRMATVGANNIFAQTATASSKFKKKERAYAYHDEHFDKESCVAIKYSGNEIPNWFSHKSEGCSIKIKLPRDWCSTDFLGFALSLVVVVGLDLWKMKIGCKYNFKTSNGESHEVNHPLYNPCPRCLIGPIDSHEVFVWWYNNVCEEVVEGAQSPTAFYKLVTEVNVEFNFNYGWEEVEVEVEVEKCGICLLYGKDAEMIKQRAL